MARSGPESGSVLLIVLMLAFLFTALAIGVATAVGIETTVASRSRDTLDALYVADAGLALVMAELRPLPDWTPVLQGAVHSAVSSGTFGGSAAAAGGGTVLLCCGSGSAAGRLERETTASAVPARRALRWQPFLWSSWDALVAQPVGGQFLLLVFVQDDEQDGDGEGGTDLNGVVVVRSEAARPDGLRRVVEGLVAREPGDPDTGVAPGVRLLAWREVR